MWVGFDPQSVERGNRGPCHIDYYGRITPDHAKGTRRFRQQTNAESETSDPGTVQLDLFTDHAKQERDKKLQLALLELKSRYGKSAVLRRMIFLEGATMRERNVLIGGHKA